MILIFADNSCHPNMTSTKAHVVVGALPFISHFTPMQTIARGLVIRGYQVTFITGGCFRRQIEQLGARCVIPPGWEELDDNWPQNSIAERISRTPIENANTNAIEFFIRPIPVEFDAIQLVLASGAMENPAQPVVVVSEASFSGGLPLRLGAPGLQPKGLVSVGINPILDRQRRHWPSFSRYSSR